MSIEQLSKAVESASAKDQSRFEEIERYGERIGQEQQNIEQRVSVLGALIGRSDEGWNLAEVEYLLGVANKQLQLLRDVKTAKVALQSADARLRELSDPHYLVVREQMAKDLQELNQLPVVDIDGISFTLGTWIERIDTLPVAGTRYQSALNLETYDADMPATVTDWKQVPRMVWELLKEHFRFREHDSPVKPMLAPEQEYFLRENLRLQLSAAQLALLRNDSARYKAALSTSRKWLAEYFAMDDAVTSELHVRLGELLEIEVAPDLPDISGSLRLLRQQMKLAVPSQSRNSPPSLPAESTLPEGITEREREVAAP
jgi:uroporphyrin-3 C-methyltransferase